jgi:hypothetical protein
MASFKFERIAPDGERFTPHCYRDGLYRVADPAHGSKKHHATRQIPVRGEEIAGYLDKHFALRMRGEISGQVNLIAASKIRKT